MRLRLLAIGLISTSTTLAGMACLPTASPAAASSGVGLRAGTFNISTIASDGSASGNHRRWKFRRGVIASEILERKLDVVGLQEADQSSIYRKAVHFGVNQYMDLRGALNHKGGHYDVTNRYAYNCLRAASSTHCKHRNRGAARDDRILYNTRTLSVVKQGSVKFTKQSRGKNLRFVAWAIFKSRKNGSQFLFTDTHLDPYRATVRKAQWSQLIRVIDRLKGGRQVVAVGDFNTSKFDGYASKYLPAMKKHGYGDTVNQTYRRPNLRSRRAADTYHAWISSFNGYRRNVRPYAYEDAKHKIGNSIDWVFASNSMHVSMWEVVTNITSSYKIRGVIPSDHNMVRANLTLR